MEDSNEGCGKDGKTTEEGQLFDKVKLEKER